MSQSVIFHKSKRGWVFHLVSNETNNIIFESRPFLFKFLGEKVARDYAKAKKAKFIPYETVEEIFE